MRSTPPIPPLLAYWMIANPVAAWARWWIKMAGR